MNLRSSARTDTGQVRETNQDAMVCLERLVAVADGMGGSPRGDRASSLAVAIVEAAFTGQSLDELGAALRAANTATSNGPLRAKASREWGRLCVLQA